MTQDFSKRITIVVRKDVPSWQSLNTVAHIAAYFGNELKDDFKTGEWLTTKDGFRIPRNCQYGIVALEASKDDMLPLIEKAEEVKVKWMAFIKNMVDHTDDIELQKELSDINAEQVEYLGVGLFGDKNQLKGLTKQFKLWK